MGFVRFGIVRIDLQGKHSSPAVGHSVFSSLEHSVFSLLEHSVFSLLEQPGYEATWNREGVSFVQEHSYKCRSGVCDLSSVREMVFKTLFISHVWEDREMEKTLQPCTGSFHSTGEEGGSIICI